MNARGSQTNAYGSQMNIRKSSSHANLQQGVSNYVNLFTFASVNPSAFASVNLSASAYVNPSVCIQLQGKVQDCWELAVVLHGNHLGKHQRSE
ncbi:unnamed protein product [Prunus brigantina]